MFLQTTGLCTGAFVEASESFFQFVEDSTARLRLNRNSSGTGCSFSEFVEGDLPHQVGP